MQDEELEAMANEVAQSREEMAAMQAYLAGMSGDVEVHR